MIFYIDLLPPEKSELLRKRDLKTSVESQGHLLVTERKVINIPVHRIQKHSLTISTFFTFY